MQRVDRGKLIRLRRALLHGRSAVVATREELIEQLGDWLCGGGTAPCTEDLEALANLCEACDLAEAQYAHCIAALTDATLARAQRK